MVTEEEPEPSDGRILVLKVTDRKMQVQWAIECMPRERSAILSPCICIGGCREVGAWSCV